MGKMIAFLLIVLNSTLIASQSNQGDYFKKNFTKSTFQEYFEGVTKCREAFFSSEKVPQNVITDCYKKRMLVICPLGVPGIDVREYNQCKRKHAQKMQEWINSVYKDPNYWK